MTTTQVLIRAEAICEKPCQCTDDWNNPRCARCEVASAINVAFEELRTAIERWEIEESQKAQETTP